MNRITIRFLLLMGILALMCARVSAQTSNSAIPVCSGSSISIGSTTTVQGLNFNHWYRVAGGNWSCCFGDNDAPYEFYVPTNGTRYEVLRVYIDQGNIVAEQPLGFYYIPVNPVINATPSPSTNCATYNGGITVIDMSINYAEMIRYFTLLDANGSVIKKDSLLNNTYTFGNLAPGTYQVKIETKCGLSDLETVVLEGATVVKADINGVTDVCLGVGTTLTATGGNFYYWSTGETGSSITVAPTTVGSHNYSVTVTAGVCSDSDSHVLTASTPTPPQINGPSTVCYNESVTLITNSIGAYSWSNGATTSSITVTLQDTRTFGLTITVPGQCPSIGSKTVTVLPAASLNPAPSSICAGENIVISVNGGSTYLWNTSETTASISRNPMSSFEYKVVVTDANQCTYTLSKNVTVESLPVVSFDGNSSVCSGENLNITASGGATYLWSHNNATTARITVNPTTHTTYTVAVTSSAGCTATAQRTITVKPAPHPDSTRIEGPTSLCSGQIIALTVVGGASGDTYKWSNGSTAHTINVNPTQNTNYMVTITNAVGCKIPKSHSVSLGASGEAKNDGPITCTKTSSTLMAVSNVQGVTYVWKNSSGATIATTANHTVTTAGVYTLVITGSGGCTHTDTTQVLLNNRVPQVVASNNGGITCAQSSSNLLGSSDMSPATYEWRNSSGTVIATTLNTSTTQAGIYTLKVTANNGCSKSDTTLVNTNLSIPDVTVEHNGPLTCTQTSITLQANSSQSNLTYIWRNSLSTTISTTSSAVVTSIGTYQLEVTGSNGCKKNINTTITQSGDFPNVSITRPLLNPLSCNSSGITLQGHSTTPNVTYAWYSPNGGPPVSTQSNYIATIAGRYTLKVTSAAGCVSTDTITVNEIVFASQAIVINMGGVYYYDNFIKGELTCTKRSITLTATARYAGYTASVRWETSNGTLLSNNPQYTVTSPGYYYCKVNGCSFRKEILITENLTPPVPLINGDPKACYGATTVLTASGGAQYAWSTGASTPSITTETIFEPTTYTVTVTSGICSTDTSIVVSTHTMVVGVTAPTQVCSGSLITVTATGGQTYKWMPGNLTTASIEVNPTVNTNYFVTITNDKGCTVNRVFNPTTHTPIININPIPNNFTLNGVPSTPFCGSAALNISVANANTSPTNTYTWKWSTGETTSFLQRTITSSQTISITATRSNGCTRTKTIPITVNPQPEGQIMGAEIVCGGDSTILTAPDGQAYQWSTGATTRSIYAKPGTNSQNFSVIVTNAGGACTATFSKTVVVPTRLNLTHTLTGEEDCHPNNVEVIPSVSGGTGNITFVIIHSWELYANPILSGLRSGTYVLVAEDENGCLALDEVTIEETPFELEIRNIDPNIDCMVGNVKLILGTKNGHGPVAIRINSSVPDTLFTLGSGKYTAHAIDSSGCRDSLKVTITDYDEVTIKVTGYGIDHCNTNDMSVNLYIEPVDSSTQYQYSLDGGQTWQSNFQFFNVPPGQYIPAVRKLLTECVTVGDPVTVGDTCSYTLIQDENLSLASNASTIQKPKESVALISGKLQLKNVLKVFPNPVMDKLQAEFKLTSAGQIQVLLLNELGKVVQHQNFEGHKGANRMNMSTQGLPPGIYIIQILDKSGQLYGVEKVIKM